MTRSGRAADSYELDPADLFTDLPRPVDWSQLSAAERRVELQRLWSWVTELVRTWPVPRDVVPQCWYRHEALIRILSADRDGYRHAYHPFSSASAAAEWMAVWDATEDRLRRWVSRTGCKSAEHRPDRLQRWVSDDDVAAAAAEEFSAFAARDHAHRVAAELDDAISDVDTEPD